jgi:hypothetical protein
MIGLRGLTALALACAASAMACSSSSGGGSPTHFACADNNPMNNASDQACTSCTESNCGAELSKAFGSGYASGNVSGGTCSSYVSCIAACACNDTSCVLACKPSADCQTDIQAQVTCEGQKCSSQCGGGTGDDGGGSIVVGSDDGSTGTGGPTGACFTSAVGVCIGGGLTASECSQAGGTTMSKCPAAGVVGCCTVAGLESCFYSPETTDTVMMSCTSNMGTFSAQP